MIASRLALAALTSWLATFPVSVEADTAVRTAWPVASRDPFWPTSQASKPVKALPSPVISPLAPPRPTAPPFAYRYLGSFVRFDGDRVVFLLKGETVVSARTGDALESGYVIQSIDDQRATVTHPALDQPILLSLGKASVPW